MHPLQTEIVNNNFHDPFRYLGVHEDQNDNSHVRFRTLQPSAQKVTLLTGTLCMAMDKTDTHGLFECSVKKDTLEFPALDPFDYQYLIESQSGIFHKINDP